MKFTKMHGLGNDYIYVNTFEEEVREPERVARIVSDRHFGIGADGLILIGSAEEADFSMDIYNADGSRGEMCGNGIRCVAKYVYERGMTNKEKLRIETLAGVKVLDLKVEDAQVTSVEVNMGKPKFVPWKTTVKVKEKPFSMNFVSMGNPHAVVFVKDVRRLPVEKVGPLIEYNEQFPNRTNVEFCEVIDRRTIRMRVWERGAGETLACGTGACAAAVAGILNDLTEEAVTVKLLGGDLFIRWDRQKNRVFMSGPAAFVFDGEIK